MQEAVALITRRSGRSGGAEAGWRQTVLANKPPPMVFVHANMLLEGDGDGDGGKVVIKECASIVRGLIESWAERGV